MSEKALEVIGKIFTGEVLDIILREGLLDYHDIVKSIEEDKAWPHPEDIAHNKSILKALAIVIEDFMEPDAYKVWLQEKHV
tara:strand:- start:674 stop:916 length:243 start_codon:yes stop_codon:yes gene_type:complete